MHPDLCILISRPCSLNCHVAISSNEASHSLMSETAKAHKGSMTQSALTECIDNLLVQRVLVRRVRIGGTFHRAVRLLINNTKSQLLSTTYFLDIFGLTQWLHCSPYLRSFYVKFWSTCNLSLSFLILSMTPPQRVGHPALGTYLGRSCTNLPSPSHPRRAASL